MLNSNMSAKIHVEAIDALTLLPTEYQQVEYVESTGTQYIDTGVRETMSIELDIEYMDRNARQLMGIGVSGSHYFGVTNDIFECAGTNFSSSINPYKRRIIDVNYILNDTNKASLSVTIDGETKTTVNGAVVQNNFLLFAPTDEENYRKIYSCYAKLYRCKITDNNGNLIRDLIPCYRKSDNVAGLYDIVNDVFYTNNGTEEFVVGSNVE